MGVRAPSKEKDVKSMREEQKQGAPSKRKDGETMRIKREDITQSDVRELVKYRPKTGQMFWKRRSSVWFNNSRSHAAWNTMHAGKEVFNGNTDGKLLGYTWMLSKLVWLYHTGQQLDGYVWKVRSINKDNSDCRIENLVAVPNYISCRVRHKKSNRNSKTGVAGVVWRADHQCYNASWSTEPNKVKGSKSYDTLEEALKQRQIHEQKTYNFNGYKSGKDFVREME